MYSDKQVKRKRTGFAVPAGTFVCCPLPRPAPRAPGARGLCALARCARFLRRVPSGGALSARSPFGFCFGSGRRAALGLRPGSRLAVRFASFSVLPPSRGRPPLALKGGFCPRGGLSAVAFVILSPLMRKVKL